MQILLIIIFGVINAVLMMFCAYEAFLKLQYGGYRTKEFERLFTAADYKRTVIFACAALLVTAVSELLLENTTLMKAIVFLIYSILCGLKILVTLTKKRKKPLVITDRLKRAAIVFLAMAAAFSIILLTAAYFILPLIFVTVLAVMQVAAPLTVVLSNHLILPYEKRIADTFLKQAKEKLESMPELIKIGITGSFGKTSVKNILAQILSRKFKVCASKASFNTPMGLCKTINNDLKKGDEILLAEMGARYTGDIAELCDFIKPDIAVITGVGNQHLETFGSVENIVAEKFTLFDYVYKKHGLIIVNGKSETAKNKLKEYTHDKYFDISSEKDYKLENCVCGAFGCMFDLEFDGHKCSFKTKLLGRHNAENIALCVLVAYKSGIGLDDIIAAVSELQPVEHRTQLISGANSENTLIIDDSYNASTQSVEASLEVLKSFEGYQKIIITPGIIELGVRQFEENKHFGAGIAGKADVCITMGINADAIKQGFLETLKGENNGKAIYIVNDLDEAVKLSADIADDKKAILFCNDLP